MRKILTITAAIAGLGLLTLAATTGAEARFGAGALAQATDASSAQPAQYYGGYYRPYYAPRYYNGDGYYDYQRYGYTGSRNALDTCSYC